MNICSGNVYGKISAATFKKIMSGVFVGPVGPFNLESF